MRLPSKSDEFGWVQERHSGSVKELHGLGVPETASRVVRWCHPTSPAIAMGSAQPDDYVDRDAAAQLGVDVVRRKSGGGAVLLEPDASVWVDVFIPASDPLWQADVGRAFWWLGDVWVETLRAMGRAEVEAYRGPLISTRWSPRVCFAGVGPGEVVSGGAKLVGISQRRTRAGALFQCALNYRKNLGLLADCLDLKAEERQTLIDEVDPLVAELDVSAKDKIEPGFLAHLPG